MRLKRFKVESLGQTSDFNRRTVIKRIVEKLVGQLWREQAAPGQSMLPADFQAGVLHLFGGKMEDLVAAEHISEMGHGERIDLVV